MEHLENIIEKIFYVLSFIVICFMLVGGIIFTSEQQKNVNEYRILDIEWYRVLDNGKKEIIKVPGKCEAKEGEVVNIMGTLPEDFNMGQVTPWLCFRTSKQNMKIYIDGDLRESYDTNNTRLWGKTSVSKYLFVPLETSDYGKEIKVSFSSISNYAGVVRDVYYGTTFGIMYHFVIDNIFEVISAVFILILSVMSIIVSGILGMKMHKKFYLGYLGWGALFLAIWIIAQSPIRQLYFNNVSNAVNITYFALFLCVIPICLFLNNVQKHRYQDIYRCILVIAIAFFCVALLLQCGGIADFSELIVFNILIDISVMVCSLGTMIVDIKKGNIKEYRLIVIGFSALAICGVLQIILYFQQITVYNGIFMCIGVVFLLIMTVISTIKDYMSMENEVKTSHQKTEKLTYQIMKTLVQTIEAKDGYTKGHSTRVAKYSKILAWEMGMDKEEQTSIYFMGMLHDIGKIGIADGIINKPERLTDEEYNIIKGHPVVGYNILKNMSEIKNIEYGARWHHERYDGKGYPDGIAGEEIPMFARIIAVADAYDAMTSNRSYRGSLSQDYVKKEIEKGSGSQFDPEVAKCMVRIIDEDRGYNLRQESK